MQAQIRGILQFDVVSSTAFAHLDLMQIVRGLRETVQAVTSQDVQAHIAGDGGVLVFPTVERGYEGLKKLIGSWTGFKKGFTSPLVPGIRLSFHAAIVNTLSHHQDALFGLPIVIGSRLMIAAPRDTVALSEDAFRFLQKLIDSDRMSPKYQTFTTTYHTLTTKHDEFLNAYIFSINDFLKDDQYLIRIESPADLLLYLASQPAQLYEIPARKFEQVIAELLADFGYDVELTKQTRDKGIDIVAVTRDAGIGLTERYLVQCKRNAPRNKVGIEIVHGILGVGAEEPNTGLIIATTSTFTKPAMQVAQKESVRWRLHLKDYDDIHVWLRTYANRRGAT